MICQTNHLRLEARKSPTRLGFHEFVCSDCGKVFFEEKNLEIGWLALVQASIIQQRLEIAQKRKAQEEQLRSIFALPNKE